MQNRIIEVATSGVHLSLFRGFVKLSKSGDELGRVGLPDIGALIIRGYGTTLSLNLAARLAEKKIPVLLCDGRQSPSSIIWPLNSHHEQGHIIEAQAALSLPQKKRLWQSLIKAKITAQAQALEAVGETAADLYEIASRVRSGDPDNQEAFAARRYWPRMMKPLESGFTRDSAQDGLNAGLNYGYTILRAGAARSIIAAGLHPSLSIHHKSRGEALRLTSDIMEPFRPWLDLLMRRILQQMDSETFALTKETKSELVKVLTLDLKGPYGASPLQTCLDRLCQSFAAICQGQRRALELPSGLAVDMKEKVK